MIRYPVFVLIFFTYAASAQQLPQPPAVQKAFAAATRSNDGKPGKAYWQNRARYTINITAAPPSRTIYGTESISYINNSPDALKELVFKLFVNIHKPGAPRMGQASKNYFTAGVVIDSVTVNGAVQKWDNDVFTMATLPLPQPLASKDSAQLFVKWHYDVSIQSGREGMIDPTTFFLAYFYPRIAVYDDYNGWDTTPFNDALEFYSDFNDYNLTVQVPKNYLVWATGTLTNPNAVLQPSFLAKYEASKTTDAVVRLVTPEDHAAKNVTAQNDVNTWQFTAANIPDVALGLSDHFVWDAGSVLVDKGTGRRAAVNAAYNDTAADFHHMVNFGKESLEWLSGNWPGIPYPYEKTTVFQGYAGMEYPMMANDETYGDTTFSRFVAMHELAHTYMPFYMGINETKYGFMDEGWATAFEFLFNSDKMGGEKAAGFFKQFRVQNWARTAAGKKDAPIILPGPEQSGANLGDNEYGKPALGYLAVKDMLGDALFKKCLQEYMARWNGKHPIPWDFFNTFSTVSGRDLNWFWNSWYFSTTYIDLSVKEVKATANSTRVMVQNIGGLPAPFDVAVTYADGTTERFHQTVAVWEKNGKAANITIQTKKEVQSVRLDGGIFMDAHSNDNEWKKGGM